MIWQQCQLPSYQSYLQMIQICLLLVVISSLCIRRINEDLAKIQEWLCANKLSLNVKKTHSMIFTRKNKIVPDIDIRINNVCIERMHVTKFLEMLIDSQLNWKQHIEYTSKKLSKCIGIL